jgi:hypothetical protein
MHETRALASWSSASSSGLPMCRVACIRNMLATNCRLFLKRWCASRTNIGAGGVPPVVSIIIRSIAATIALACNRHERRLPCSWDDRVTLCFLFPISWALEATAAVENAKPAAGEGGRVKDIAGVNEGECQLDLSAFSIPQRSRCSHDIRQQSNVRARPLEDACGPMVRRRRSRPDGADTYTPRSSQANTPGEGASETGSTTGSAIRSPDPAGGVYV